MGRGLLAKNRYQIKKGFYVYESRQDRRRWTVGPLMQKERMAKMTYTFMLFEIYPFI